MPQIALLAGGCFWCLEAVFQKLKGVERVVSGYIGGNVRNPNYDRVSVGTTGHAEAIEITFDPAVISYRELLEIFFAFHDPTTLNRQGADRGTQYRSAIFPTSAEQRDTAESVIADLGTRGIFGDPIVTTIEPSATFYPAEAYHQDYYRRHQTQPYCVFSIEPKVAKLRSQYAERLKPEAFGSPQETR